MKNLHRVFAAASAAFFIACAPAIAQWQVPNHSIPLGKGLGTGFGSLGCSGFLVGTGAGADPTCRGIVTGDLPLGTSVLNPGTGTLEAVLPIQTVTGASKSFLTADLFKETRRSNSGSAMSDTFPASSATGLVNGTKITLVNVDATASDTVTAGAGTTISGTGIVGPGRAIQYVFDAPNTIWRPTLNTGTALLGPNNLSDLASAATARNNLGLNPANNNVTILTSGTGGQTRTLGSMLAEFPTSLDWDTGAHALATAQGLLWVPSGAATLPAYPFAVGSFPNAAQFYVGPTLNFNAGAPLGTGENAHTMLSVQHAGGHPTSNDSSLAIVTNPVGSGGSGGTGDVSLTISNIKQNFQTTTTTGDLSGANIILRNGGSDTGRSDTAALNIDVSSVGTTGQLFAFEAAVKNFNRSGVQVLGVDIQAGTIDAINGHIWGYVANLDTGIGDVAFLAQQAGSSSWSKVLNYITVAGGNRFSIEGNASIKMYPTDGTSTDFISLVNTHSTVGKFRLLNSGGFEFFAVEGSTGQVSASSYAGQFVNLGGVNSPFVSFSPAAGATKSGLIQQTGDVLGLVVSGTGNALSVNLTTRAIKFDAYGAGLLQTDASGNVTAGTLGAAGGGTGSSFFQVAGPATTVKTYTFPNADSTVATLGAVQTWTAANNFNYGTILLNGLTSGAVALTPQSIATGTLILPNGPETLVGLATTNTLTNKTISGASNTLSNIANASLTNSSVTIGSTSVSLGGTAATISGLTLVSPALGTPASGVMTNVTGLPTTALTGALQAAQEPAHTGDVTNTAGSLALTIANNAVTLAKLATQAANTVLVNATSGSAVPTALAVGSCDTATKALQWTTNTGFGCNTSITAAAVPASGLTGATLASGVTASSLTSVGTSLNIGGSSVTGRQLVVYGTSQAAFAFRDDGGTATFKTMGLLYDGKNALVNPGLIMQNIGDTGTFVSNSGAWWRDGAFSFGTVTYPGEAGSILANVNIYAPNLPSDTATADSTVCTATTGGKFLKGTGTLGICLGTSGRQFKTAFEPMVAGLDDLVKINFQNYYYREGFGDGGARRQYGTTAQDVEIVLPELVRHDADGQALNYDSGALLFIGLRAIQQLKADNDNLRNRIVKLENGK